MFSSYAYQRACPRSGAVHYSEVEPCRPLPGWAVVRAEELRNQGGTSNGPRHQESETEEINIIIMPDFVVAFSVVWSSHGKKHSTNIHSVSHRSKSTASKVGRTLISKKL